MVQIQFGCNKIGLLIAHNGVLLPDTAITFGGIEQY